MEVNIKEFERHVDKLKDKYFETTYFTSLILYGKRLEDILVAISRL